MFLFLILFNIFYIFEELKSFLKVSDEISLI